MKPTILKSLLALGCVSLFYSTTGLSQVASSGNLTQLQTNNTTTTSLNILQLGMFYAFKNAAQYQADHHQCPPADLLLQNYGQKNLVVYITNKADGSIYAQFSSQAAPGPLKGKYVRWVPKRHGKICDYAAQLCVTDIDFNGNSQSFLLNPPVNFAYSTNLQASNFGNCSTTSTSNALNIDFDTLLNNSYVANTTASYATPGSQTSIG